MDLWQKLEELKQTSLSDIQKADNEKKVNDIRVSLLGKKGALTEILRGMKDLSPEDRPKVGSFANTIRDELTKEIAKQAEQIEVAMMAKKLEKEKIDVTLPGVPVKEGQPHILMQVIDQLEKLFLGMGYKIVDGPEVEEDHYNFEMLNLPKDHPAISLSKSWCGPKLRQCKPGPWKNMTFLRAHWRWFHQGRFTGAIQMMQPTRTNSTKLKGWSSTKISPWRT